MTNDDLILTACGIYGLRSRTTGKWYIGQSTDIDNRFYQYESLQCKNQTKLYNALKKYGYEDFDKVILEQCSCDPDVLTEREGYWMGFYNALTEGYNIREAGRRGKRPIESRIKMSESAKNKPPMTEETRKKFSLVSMGHICSEETKAKIGQANRGRKFGPMSNERKIKISIANLGRKNPKISAIQTGKKRKPFTKEHKKNLSLAIRAAVEKKKISYYKLTN